MSLYTTLDNRTWIRTYFLGHLENEEYVAKGRTIAECAESNDSGDKFEKEANTFAKHLLAPFPIIKRIVEA